MTCAKPFIKRSPAAAHQGHLSNLCLSGTFFTFRRASSMWGIRPGKGTYISSTRDGVLERVDFLQERNIGVYGKAESRRTRAADQPPGWYPAGRRRCTGLCARRRSLHPCPSRTLADQLVRLPGLLGWRPGGAALSRGAVLLAVRPAGQVYV